MGGDGWEVRYVEGAAHVVPVDDLVVHEPEDCVCQPRFELETSGERTDMPDIHRYVHHSLDGREIKE